MSYYMVKVDLIIQDETTGKLKRHTEQYIVNAVSVTDAEAKVYADFEGYTGDFEVVSTVKTKIAKVLE